MIDIVFLPMVLQTPSAPSVFSQTPPLGTMCSVQWLAASIGLCIGQALAVSQKIAISGSCQQALLRLITLNDRRKPQLQDPRVLSSISFLSPTAGDSY